VRSTEFDQLNRSAQVVFENINFREPKVLYNGETCSSEVCDFIFNNGNLTLNVSGFSEYEVVEGYHVFFMIELVVRE
jgi:hypothetical protein